MWRCETRNIKLQKEKKCQLDDYNTHLYHLTTTHVTISNKMLRNRDCGMAFNNDITLHLALKIYRCCYFWLLRFRFVYIYVHIIL